MKKKKASRLVGTSVLFLFLALWILPFLLIIVNSFKKKISIVKYPLKLVDDAGIQWNNYVKAIDDMNFLRSFINSLLIAVVSVLLLVILSSMSAYLFARKDWRICKISFSLLISSMVIPFQVVMIPLLLLYGSKLQLLNSIWLMIFFNLGFCVSLGMFMCHGYIKTNIPRELEEAAKIDGCNMLGCFLKIILPLLKPILSTITILNTIHIWNDYLLPSLVLRQQKLHTLTIALRTFYGEFSNDYGSIMAGLVMLIIPIVIFFTIMQKQIISGVMSGSVKS